MERIFSYTKFKTNGGIYMREKIVTYRSYSRNDQNA